MPGRGADEHAQGWKQAGDGVVSRPSQPLSVVLRGGYRDTWSNGRIPGFTEELLFFLGGG